MKIFILVDNENIVRCIASLECNLHKDKIEVGMKKYYTELNGNIGDEYDPETDKWISRPENYPKPSEEEMAEQKIQEEIRKIAIKALKDRGEIPSDYN